MPWVRPALAAALLLAALLAGCTHDPGTTDPLTDFWGRPLGDRLRVVKVAEGLDQPLLLTHAGDGSGRLFIVEQPGTVRVVTDGKLLDAPFADVRERVRAGGERGLLGLAFHPGFPAVDRVFLSYTDRDGDSVVSWMATTDEGARLDADAENVVLRVQQPYGNHNGGMIAFGPDGYLYFALGDGGSGGDPHGHAQDLTTLLGAMLRLDVSGAEGYTVPEDNPFVDDPDARDEIWAYGFRNPWRFSFDSETGDLWIADVGEAGREEVNFVPAGEGAGWNFGWNAYEGTVPFSGEELEDVVFPVAEYERKRPHCAVTGGYVYRGAEVESLQGVYLFGDYCSGWLWGLEDNRGEWKMGLLFDSPHRISSFGADEAGEVYMVDHNGSVHRLAPL